MSAYVVEDQVINSVIASLSTYTKYGCFSFHDTVKSETGCDLEDPKDRAKLADEMFSLNCNAVDQRYGDGQSKEFRDLNFQYRAALPPPLIQAYKSLGCWLYQCAEGTVPETSLLYAAMMKVHAEMAHELVRSSKAYDASAGW